jgi:hypothetical protein
MFAEGRSVEEVSQAIGRAPSTVVDYLALYIEIARPARIHPWVDEETYRLVSEAASKEDSRFLKPIYDCLGGRVPYERIKLTLAHRAIRNLSKNA